MALNLVEAYESRQNGSNFCAFIESLSNYFSSRFFNTHSKQNGEVSCEIMKDKNNQSRRFGFVEIREHNNLPTSIGELDLLGQIPSSPHVVDGKQVDCKMAVPKDPQ